MKPDYDIVILGAGPAGCACAFTLKESGLRIALVEKSQFPRDKVCGDAIGGRVKKVLRQESPALADGLEAFPLKNLSSGWKLFAPNGKSIAVEFVNSGYVSRRLDFDAWLYGEVIRQDGLETVHAEVVDAVPENNGIELILWDKSSLHASLVIACDGAHSVVAKKLAGFKVDHRHYSGAVRAYYNNVGGTDQSNLLEIHLVEGFLPGYFWIFPLGDGLSNVGFGMLSDDVKRKRIDLKDSLRQIIHSSPTLSARFAGAVLADEIRGFGLPLGGIQRPVSGNRFMLCGDAASLIDPLTGEGIGNAMLSGVMSAKQALKCFSAADFTPEEIRKYDRAIYQKLLPELRKNLFLQRTFNRPWLINFLVAAARMSPFLKNWLAKKL